MPKKLEDCVKELIRQGYNKDQAWAICTSAISKDKAEEIKFIRGKRYKH